MADGGDANGPVLVAELVDDPIGADAQREQAAHPALKRVSGMRVATEQGERFLNGVDQWPVERAAQSARGERARRAPLVIS
jgi:hypothetical protein